MQNEHQEQVVQLMDVLGVDHKQAETILTRAGGDL